MAEAGDWKVCQYFGYWDVPRQLVLMRDNQALYLECEFDERLDDYPPSYQVWTLGSVTADELFGLAWEEIEKHHRERIADIPLMAIEFAHPTERRNGRSYARYRFREC